MSGEKVPEYKQSAAGAPAGGHGVTAPRPRGAAPARGYGAPPGHAPPSQDAPYHFAQPHYVAPGPRPAQAKPQPQYAGGFTTHQQQQQIPPPNVVYGTPPVVYQQQPGAYQQQPGAYQQQPGAYQQQPGAYQQQPGSYQQQPGAYQPQPGVYAQQAVGAPPMQQLGTWTTGLFDCGEDPNNCVITFFLPCITFGQIAEVLDQGTTSCLLAGSIWMTVLLCFGCPCFVSCLWRTKLRAKYNLPQDEVGDICLHFWCESCALCQEYRELNNRGLNPSLGWEHHRQQQYAQMGAPNPVYMQR